MRASGASRHQTRRRGSETGVARRVFDRLAAYFGRDALFNDVGDIPSGVNFERVIAEVIDAAAVLLALAGPTWAPSPPRAGADWMTQPISSGWRSRPLCGAAYSPSPSWRKAPPTPSKSASKARA